LSNKTPLAAIISTGAAAVNAGCEADDPHNTARRWGNFAGGLEPAEQQLAANSGCYAYLPYNPPRLTEV
jgi:hypothetical protein